MRVSQIDPDQNSARRRKQIGGDGHTKTTGSIIHFFLSPPLPCLCHVVPLTGIPYINTYKNTLKHYPTPFLFFVLYSHPLSSPRPLSCAQYCVFAPFDLHLTVPIMLLLSK